MDLEQLARAATVTAPKKSEIAVIAVAITSAAADLSAAGQLGALATTGRMLTLKADGGKIWFFFDSDGTGTVDETATTGANRAFSLDDGERQDFVLQGANTQIITKGSAVCKLRIAVTSPAGGAG